MNVRGRLLRMFGPLEGGRIPGGCESCDAYQTVEPIRADIWRITTHHDDTCPWLRSRRNREKTA